MSVDWRGIMYMFGLSGPAVGVIDSHRVVRKCFIASGGWIRFERLPKQRVFRRSASC
jgi:hypothetical protein